LKLKFGTSLTSQGIATVSETILNSRRCLYLPRRAVIRVRLRTFL